MANQSSITGPDKYAAYGTDAAFGSKPKQEAKFPGFPDGQFDLRVVPQADRWAIFKVWRHWLKWPGAKGMLVHVCTREDRCISCMIHEMAVASTDPLLAGLVAPNSEENPKARAENYAVTIIRGEVDPKTGIPVAAIRKLPKAIVDQIDLYGRARNFVHPVSGRDLSVFKGYKNPAKKSTAEYKPSFADSPSPLASTTAAIDYILANQPDLYGHPEFKPIPFSEQVRRLRATFPDLYTKLVAHFGPEAFAPTASTGPSAHASAPARSPAPAHVPDPDPHNGDLADLDDLSLD